MFQMPKHVYLNDDKFDRFNEDEINPNLKKRDTHPFV